MRALLIGGEKCFLDNIVNDLKKVFTVDIAKNGFNGTYMSQINNYDFTFVKSTLSDMDSTEVCRMIRVENVHTCIVLVSDNSEKLNRVMSLDAGADIIISTEIGKEELFAQIRSLVRRHEELEDGVLLKVGKVEMNMKSRKVIVDGEIIFLRRKEFDLLEYLLIHRDEVISKEELLEHIWEDGVNIFSNTVEVHIRNVRSRMESVLGDGVVKTVRGFGYKIET